MRKIIFRKTETLFLLLLCVLPFAFFIHFMTDFIFPKGSIYSDYTISHYPNLLFLQRSIFSNFTLPLWNPQILSGFPNIANPLTGLWYPGNWVSILFPLPFGSHLVTVFHIVSGGLGMYAFLRQRKNTAYAAFLGALSFEFLPKLFVHYAAGHISWVQAITWTPWLLLLQQNRYKLSCKSRAYWYQSCVMYALILLCDLRWVAYAFILDGLFFINQLWINKPVNLRDFLIKIAGWISQIIGGLFLSAIFLIPFFEYLRLTDRSKLLANDILNYGLPVGKLLGLIIPDMGDMQNFLFIQDYWYGFLFLVFLAFH